METENILSLLQNNKEELFLKAKEKKGQFYNNIVTFSRNVFVPVTRQCRNRCGYCGFVSDDASSWITPDKYQILLKKSKDAKCKEILLTLGEKPEEKYQTAKDFLLSHNFESTVDYVNSFCETALDNFLLPHSNLGILSFEELKLLKETNASMGLMLETSSSRLMEAGGAHHYSPGKDPSVRLETLSNAGKLKIPFTSGILIGIGESWAERIESLQTIEKIYKKYNNIQEVIVQNFNPQPNTPMSDWLSPTDEEILLTLSIARIVLSPTVNIQIPPNLNKDRIVEALDSGANDVGGISPLTIDYINPNMDWHEEKMLYKQLGDYNYELIERLPVYPPYEKYLNTRLREIIEDYHHNEETLYSKNR